MLTVQTRSRAPFISLFPCIMAVPETLDLMVGVRFPGEQPFLFSGSSMVRAPGLHPGCCRFDPYPENQEGWQSPAYRTALEMRQTLKSLSGSNPLPSANLEEWPSGLRRRFAKPLGANNASQVRILLLPPIWRDGRAWFIAPHWKCGGASKTPTGSNPVLSANRSLTIQYGYVA